jgi:hypothetical protein
MMIFEVSFFPLLSMPWTFKLNTRSTNKKDAKREKNQWRKIIYWQMIFCCLLHVVYFHVVYCTQFEYFERNFRLTHSQHSCELCTNIYKLSWKVKRRKISILEFYEPWIVVSSLQFFCERLKSVKSAYRSLTHSLTYNDP